MEFEEIKKMIKTKIQASSEDNLKVTMDIVKKFMVKYCLEDDEDLGSNLIPNEPVQSINNLKQSIQVSPQGIDLSNEGELNTNLIHNKSNEGTNNIKTTEDIVSREPTLSNCTGNLEQNKDVDKINTEPEECIITGDIWPFIDITEYSNSYIVEVEVPGFKKEDIDISYDKNKKILSLDGRYIDKSEEYGKLVYDINTEEVEDDNASLVSNSSLSNVHEILLNERMSKKDFKKSFKFKKSIIPNEIQADLGDGVLRLEIPKSKEKENKVVINII